MKNAQYKLHASLVTHLRHRPLDLRSNLDQLTELPQMLPSVLWFSRLFWDVGRISWAFFLLTFPKVGCHIDTPQVHASWVTSLNSDICVQGRQFAERTKHFYIYKYAHVFIYILESLKPREIMTLNMRWCIKAVICFLVSSNNSHVASLSWSITV
jgi:hypothetical protein